MTSSDNLSDELLDNSNILFWLIVISVINLVGLIERRVDNKLTLVWSYDSCISSAN